MSRYQLKLDSARPRFLISGRQRWLAFSISFILSPLLIIVIANSNTFSSVVQAAASPDLDYYEQRVVELTNAKRALFNLPPLRQNRELTLAARNFSRDVVVNQPGYCGHLSSDGVYPDVRTKRAGYYGISGAENCVCGFTTPENAVDAWFNEVPPNDGHRRNLLNPDSREVGIGYYLDTTTGRGYIAQDFGQDAAYPPLVISNDAPVTTSSNVNLYIYGALPNSDTLYAIGQPIQMRVSNRPDFSNASWETYQSTKSWTLDSATTGFKTVYVELRDSTGKSTVSSDNIYYGPQIPYGYFDSLAQASTHLESFNINGLNSAGKPFMQFSPNWGLNSQDGKMSLNWGKGSSVSDAAASSGKAFQLLPNGNNESNAWLYTTSYIRDLPSQVYFRLKLSNLSAPRATIRLVVSAAEKETTLSLTTANFKAAGVYQEFPVSFTQANIANKSFLSFMVGFTDPDNTTTLNIDRMDIYTAPETANAAKSWSAPDKNYRGAVLKVRYSDNAASNPAFSEAQLVGPFLPPLYNPNVVVPITTTPTSTTGSPTSSPASTVVPTTPPASTATPTVVPTTPPTGSPVPTPTQTTPTPTPTGTGGSDIYPTPQPASNPDPAFLTVWERTDDPVFKGKVRRSWMWGDRPGGFDLLNEPYDGRQRLVQYHDKSRMEINNPNGNRNDLFFVTNGLLVREMISGKMQIGDSTYISRQSAQIPVAGDPVNPNAPTYASFQNLTGLDQRANNRTGQTVTTALARDGNTRELSNVPATVRLSYFENTLGHNIPDVFWNFMNSRGTIVGKGGYYEDTVISWVYAMGYPIGEPYWTRALVAGVEKDVLVQVYERRVLTYTPTNPAGFEVEMGNVGQHYHRWRYGF